MTRWASFAGERGDPVVHHARGRKRVGEKFVRGVSDGKEIESPRVHWRPINVMASNCVGVMLGASITERIAGLLFGLSTTARNQWFLCVSVLVPMASLVVDRPIQKVSST